MMTEISLNILDVAENSIRAKANNINIKVLINSKDETMTIIIADDGCGMTAEQVSRVRDPFFTTRTTRKVGLGVPFFEEAAIQSGGSFAITSEVGVGTTVKAVFCTNSVDCMPLGDINGTIYTLIAFNEGIDFVYTYEVDGVSFVLDTSKIKEILGDVSFANKEVSDFIKDYLKENTREVEEHESKGN